MSETKPLTGRKVFWMFFAAFAVIFGVNMLLLFKAINTFPGLEVKNSYVASQDFNNRADAQRALGWTPAVQYGDGQVDVSITSESGAPVFPANLAVRIGRPTHGREDLIPELSIGPNGYSFAVDLDVGKWFVYVTAQGADGAPFYSRLELHVTDGNG